MNVRAHWLRLKLLTTQHLSTEVIERLVETEIEALDVLLQPPTPEEERAIRTLAQICKMFNPGSEPRRALETIMAMAIRLNGVGAGVLDDGTKEPHP